MNLKAQKNYSVDDIYAIASLGGQVPSEYAMSLVADCIEGILDTPKAKEMIASYHLVRKVERKQKSINRDIGGEK